MILLTSLILRYVRIERVFLHDISLKNHGELCDLLKSKFND